MIKIQMPTTWNGVKEQPQERVLSFLRAIVSTHIGIFTQHAFKRNPIETIMTPDADGNMRSDRYRISRMRINEEHVTISTMDMRQIADQIFAQYRDEISDEEVEYYRRNLTPSKLHQQMIRIYFFKYVGSSQELSLLRNIDWYRLLLCMRNDIMKRFNIDKSMLLDAALPLIITANAEISPVGDRMMQKDLKFLADNATYKRLEEKYYRVVTAIQPDAIKKLLIDFANAKYTFVLHDQPDLYGREIEITKRQLIEELMSFLIISNENISMKPDDEDEFM